MPEPVIFKDLPATFPEKDKYKKPSVIGSIVFHALLIFAVIIVPLLMPQTIPERELIVTLVSPIGSPPPPPPPVEIPVITAPKAVQPQVRSVAPDALIAPVAVPKEVVKIVEEPIVPAVGVIGGVPGGMPGGIAGGVLGGILAANAAPAPVLAPPPPPPPPPPTPPPQVAAPTAPIRIGGVVKEPQVIKHGIPVPVILTAKVHFNKAPVS